MHIHTLIYTHVYIYMHIHAQHNAFVCVHVYMHKCTYITHMHKSIYACCMCIHVHVYIHVYMHAYSLIILSSCY